MFRDALMESEGRLTTKSKYFSVLSFTLNGLLLLGLILWPLLHPLALPKQAMAMLLVAPTPPPAPAPMKAAAPRTASRPETLTNQLLAPSTIPKIIATDPSPVPTELVSMAGVPGGIGSGNDAGGIGNLLGLGRGTAPIVAVAKPRRIAISSGVMAGNRISGADPSYPAIARSARIQGTVVLQATISKTGAIENLRVLSGPPMLVGNAIEAVKNWRYRPYQLNSEPVEVETTINVVFSLGS